MKNILIQTKEKLVSFLWDDEADFNMFLEIKSQLERLGILDQNYVLISKDTTNDPDYLKEYSYKEFGYRKICGMTFREVWFPFCDNNTMMIVPESILFNKQ